MIAEYINRTDFTDFTDAYEALKKCVTVGNRREFI